jgi:hypothetical protein
MKRILAALALTLATPGCALVDVNVSVPTQTQERKPPVGTGREVYVRLPFADARQITARCGMQKDGYNIDSADVPCPGPPAVWFGDLFVTELRARGFVVRTEGAPRSADPLVLEGYLQKLFLEPVIGFIVVTEETDFQLELLASSHSGLVAQRTFFIKGEKNAVFPDDGDFQESLDRATKAMVDQLVAAIVELMYQYPSVGRLPPPERVATLTQSSEP